MKSRKVFIQQPYFLPWLGFLAKLAKADHYIALDNAPFRRNHLHRSSILGPGGDRLWLSCPVGASQGTPISKIKIPSNTKYIKKFIQTIKHSYRKAKHFDREINIIEKLLRLYIDNSGQHLSEMNIRIISELIEYFDIEIISLERESAFNLCSNRNLKTIELMNLFDGTCIICGDGGSTIVHDISLFRKNGISIELVPCFLKHPQYYQKHSTKNKCNFVPGLSFIDALLNIGRDSVISLIKEGFPSGDTVNA